jgi:uncharacterized membrane protein
MIGPVTVSTARRVSLTVAALFYLGAGCLHFVKPAAYLKIMPAYVPWPLAMIYVSGAAEIAGGIGLLIAPLRRAAAWGIVALLFAVLPANVYMAANHIQVTASPVSDALLWARLPLQFLLMWWVLWSTGRPPYQASAHPAQ